jgi:serine/threonine protein kinase
MNEKINGNGKTLIGKRIGGKYQIIDKIGEGGMGAIYKGYDSSLNRFVAVKVLNDIYLAVDEAVERFKQEAQATAQLGHPNILSVIEFITSSKKQNLLCIVSEFLVGEDLEKALRDGPFPIERASRIIFQVLEAISTAHSKGIVHRDLKPGNIFLLENPPDFVKILDFGLAKIFSDLDAKQITKEIKMFGTPRYMSPEQCLGRKVDHRTDIYSCGMILYEMLEGAHPFDGGTQEIIKKQISEPPKEPVNCSKAVAKVILKALEKEPEKRFQSAVEFKEALEAALKPKRVSFFGNVVKRISILSKGNDSKKNGASGFSIPIEIAPTISASSSFSPPSPAKDLGKEKVEKEKTKVEEKSNAKYLTLTFGLMALLVVAIAIYLIKSPDQTTTVSEKKPRVEKVEKVKKKINVVEEKKVDYETESQSWMTFLKEAKENEETNFEKAVTLYKKAAELAPEESRADIYKTLGKFLLRNGRKNEAAEALQKYLELKPDAPDAPFYRGVIRGTTKK